ncbi:Nto1p ASCRUDRAFT_26536, partial [Ascoidea rubescens DSM 1968]
QVVYDMDEQDDFYLSMINKRRLKVNHCYISHELFEIVITFLEKQWHLLSKRIPPKQKYFDIGPDAKEFQDFKNLKPGKYNIAVLNALVYGSDDGVWCGPEQDQPCAICYGSECDNANQIVFCDGCDIAVHQECYGVVYIPEGQWYCRHCMTAKKKEAHCQFCPSTTGAFKQTESGDWAHVICGLWIPELTFKSPVYMETIDNIENVPKGRWNLTCYICKQKCGACIQCANKNCAQAYHVTCARRSELFMKHNLDAGMQNSLHLKNFVSFCDRHTPTTWLENHDIKEGIKKTRLYYQENKKDENNRNSNNNILRWESSIGTPILPNLIWERLIKLLEYFQIDGSAKLSSDLCKYWALKRETKTAPLIKLHDPYTTSNNIKIEEIPEKIEMANFLNGNINNLIKISDDIIKRQQLTLEKFDIDLKNIGNIYFPVIKLIKPVLEELLKLDEENNRLLWEFKPSIFKGTKLEYNIDILNLESIVLKFKLNQYSQSLLEFNNDIKILFDNVNRSKQKTNKVLNLKKLL